MSDYATKNIRNVCLIAHGNAGKTSLCEAMLYNAKSIDRLGKTLDGNTVSDFDPEEIKRKISINTSVSHLEWKDTKINILDAPGYADFVGEQIEALAAAEAAVIVVSGKSGVSVGTENAWRMAKAKNMPVAFFVNKMDNPKSNYEKCINELKENFGKSIAPFTFPINDGDEFIGFVDIVRMKAKFFNGTNNDYVDIPAEHMEFAKGQRDMLSEAVAEVSDELMEKYFAGEEFTTEEIKAAMRIGVKEGSVAPCVCGSATSIIGINKIMSIIVEYFPSPDEVEKPVGVNAKTEEPVEIDVTPDGDLAALVFKTVVDPYIGKMSMIKVVSGVLKADSTVYNANKGENEKIGKLYMLKGKKQIDVPSISAGDIGCTTKLALADTSDTLCDAKNPIILEKIEFPEPVLSLAIVPKAKGDEEKISTGLTKLQEEDPAFKVWKNKVTNETIVSGTGEQHLNIITAKLQSKFGVAVDLIAPKIAYKEAIKKKVKAEGKHKKQSGGHGQYGHVWIEFEPCDSEELVFEEKVFGGSVPKNFFPAIEKGLKDATAQGVLAGYPVVNLKATLLDGSYHPVDSSEMAFKTAAGLAYRAGLAEANPVLLEPVGALKVRCRNVCTGDVVGDINKRRGRILGMNPISENHTEVVAEVPEAEMATYAIDLRAITNGRGTFAFKFERYEEVPPNVAEKIIAENKKA